MSTCLRRIFVPQLSHREEVAPILRKFGFTLPMNVRKAAVTRWHFGDYYGYGNRESWIPLGSTGGMATKAFHGHTVKFPVRIDRKLRAMLDDKRRTGSR